EAPTTSIGVVPDLWVARQRQPKPLRGARSPGDLEPRKISADDLRYVGYVQGPADVPAGLLIVVLERGVEPESVFHDRSSGSGRGGVGIRLVQRRIGENSGAFVDGTAHRFSALIGEGRILTVERRVAVPLVRSLARNGVDHAAEDVVFGIETTRDHLDGIDA